MISKRLYDYQEALCFLRGFILSKGLMITKRFYDFKEVLLLQKKFYE